MFYRIEEKACVGPTTVRAAHARFPPTAPSPTQPRAPYEHRPTVTPRAESPPGLSASAAELLAQSVPDWLSRPATSSASPISNALPPKPNVNAASQLPASVVPKIASSFA